MSNLKTDTFCCHCKVRTGSHDEKLMKTRNGRTMIKSLCNVCDGRKCQFVTAQHMGAKPKRKQKGGNIVGDFFNLF